MSGISFWDHQQDIAKRDAEIERLSKQVSDITSMWTEACADCVRLRDSVRLLLAEQERDRLREALERYCDANFWAWIVAEARAGTPSVTIADIGSREARALLEGE